MSLENFEERYKSWAERPPATLPEEAARQVLARLDEPERGRAPIAPWLAAAAVLVLAVTIGLLVTPSASPPPPPLEAAAPALDDGVVLIWLDSETPLYMSFAPPPAEEGDPS